MAVLLDFPLSTIRGNKEQVFLYQGIKKEDKPSDRTISLFYKAEDIFSKLADPAGILDIITIPEFEKVFKGIGNNLDNAVVDTIYPKADSLALFAFTLGQTISRKIKELFDQNDLPLAVMLDSIASVCAETAATAAEERFLLIQKQLQKADNSSAVLLYSPGYCGWHISGQQALFNYLKPEKIGLTLNQSFLMIPLKSISGVLILAKKETHIFEPGFPYCKDCRAKSCYSRIQSLGS